MTISLLNPSIIPMLPIASIVVEKYTGIVSKNEIMIQASSAIAPIMSSVEPTINVFLLLNADSFSKKSDLVDISGFEVLELSNKSFLVASQLNGLLAL